MNVFVCVCMSVFGGGGGSLKSPFINKLGLCRFKWHPPALLWSLLSSRAALPGVPSLVRPGAG